MNEQVLTTTTSASSALAVSFAPACASMPIMTSLSTKFFGQPRLTNPTFRGAGLGEVDSGISGAATVRLVFDMQSLDFIIRMVDSRCFRSVPHQQIMPLAACTKADITSLEFCFIPRANLIG